MCFNLEESLTSPSEVYIPLRQVTGPKRHTISPEDETTEGLVDIFTFGSYDITIGNRRSHVPNTVERAFFFRDLPFDRPFLMLTSFIPDFSPSYFSYQAKNKTISCTINVAGLSKIPNNYGVYGSYWTAARYDRIILGGYISGPSMFHYDYHYPISANIAGRAWRDTQLKESARLENLETGKLESPQFTKIRPEDVSYSFAEINYRDRTFSIGHRHKNKDTFFQRVSVPSIQTQNDSVLNLDVTLFEKENGFSELAAVLNNTQLSHSSNKPVSEGGFNWFGTFGYANVNPLASGGLSTLKINSVGQRSQDNKFQVCSASAVKTFSICFVYPSRLNQVTTRTYLESLVKAVNSIFAGVFIKFEIQDIYPAESLNSLTTNPWDETSCPATFRYAVTGSSNSNCSPDPLFPSYRVIFDGCGALPGFSGWMKLSNNRSRDTYVLAHELGHNFNCPHENNNSLMGGKAGNKISVFSQQSEETINSRANSLPSNLYTQTPPRPVYVPQVPPPPPPPPPPPGALTLRFTKNLPLTMFAEFDDRLDLSVSFEALDANNRVINASSVSHLWQSKRAWESNFRTILQRPLSIGGPAPNRLLKTFSSGLPDVGPFPPGVTAPVPDNIIYEDIRCIINADNQSITSNILRVMPRPQNTRLLVDKQHQTFKYELPENFSLDSLPTETQNKIFTISIRNIKEGSSYNWYPTWNPRRNSYFALRYPLRELRSSLSSDFNNFYTIISANFPADPTRGTLPNAVTGSVSPYTIDFLPSNFSGLVAAFDYETSTRTFNKEGCFLGAEDEWNLQIVSKIESFMIDKDISIPIEIFDEYPLVKQVYGYDNNNKFVFWQKNYQSSNLKFLVPGVTYTIISEDVDYTISYQRP